MRTLRLPASMVGVLPRARVGGAGRQRAAMSATGLVVLGLVAGACDSAPDPEDVGQAADATAAALAQSLQRGDLDPMAFLDVETTEVMDDYDEVVAGMGERSPAVTVGGVEEEGDSATARLVWSWTLSPTEEWTYDADVSLVRVEGEWKVEWDHSVVEPSLNAASVLEATTISAARGDILGAGGLKIVTTRPVVDVGIDRTQVGERRAVAAGEMLASAAGVDVKPFAEQVEAAGESAFVSAITYRADDVPAQLARRIESIPGARLVSREQPLAPTREFAAPIIGSVGEVTAEMIEDEPDRYEAGDVAGLSGIQERYDDQLRGTPGVVVNAVGSDDQERELARAEALPGQPLALTLDIDLQTEAESLLSNVDSGSALVAVKPSTGQILAAANGPANAGQNLATFGQYAPGSTFKAVTSLALLRAGLTPDSPVPCAASTVVDGKTFTNYSDYPAGGLGTIPLRTAVANSCNTAFIDQRTELQPGDLADAAATLGLGVDHDLGFPAYFGSVEPAETETEEAAGLIGQGTVLASPMAMAAVIASVQAGEVVVPRLIRSVEVAPPDHSPMSGAETTALQTMLREVVSVGSASALGDVPGPPVIAKTGTAEFESDTGLQTHAWMIAAQGDLAVAVFVGIGESGSQTAGPIIEEFLRAAQ